MKNLIKLVTETENLSIQDRIFIYQQLLGDKTFSPTFLKREILGLDDEEINDNDKELIRDAFLQHVYSNVQCNGINEELAESDFNRYEVVPLEDTKL